MVCYLAARRHCRDTGRRCLGSTTQKSDRWVVRRAAGGGAHGGRYRRCRLATPSDEGQFEILVRKEAAPVVSSRCASEYLVVRMPATMAEDAAGQAAMARVRYMRVAESIPADGRGLARYWKTYYNTPLGAGTVAEFVANWNRLLAPALYPAIA